MCYVRATQEHPSSADVSNFHILRKEKKRLMTCELFFLPRIGVYGTYTLEIYFWDAAKCGDTLSI